MQRVIRVSCFAIGALVCAASSAAQSNGQLPMYPNGHDLNNMPAAAVAMGVPMVLESSDSVNVVDAWYTSNATTCKRSTASGGVKYQCPTGSIMLYDHAGKTQIALVPGR